ncbi:transporter [Flavobacterium sp. NST-5]|uniref:Transporter n=1 Tax=Flavobacterium ichthyis TaxID=2698827 RepID=A0ABW9Z5P2_9FLAO|nr:transporter [Flavobacterium ichthyis]NBL63999.1 transporter [Flavobacterium ichthyis]
MPSLKSWVVVSSIFLSFGVSAQFTDVINSNRPGESMSGFSVGKSVFQTEAGIYAIQEDHSLLNTETSGFGLEAAFRYGAFLEQLEFIANLRYQADQFTTPFGSENRSSVRNFILGAKYLIYDPFKNYEEKVNIYSWKANQRFKWRQFIPSVSVYAGANINFSDNPYTFANDPQISPKFMVITQNHFGNKTVFVMNIIVDKITSDYPSYGLIGTLTYGFNPKWSGFIEGQGYKSDFYSDAIARVGAAYLLAENLQIDASISKNIKDTPDILYGGVGFSWRFDGFYKDILLKNPDKEEKKSKADKKKEKEKKRIDEVGGNTVE